MRANAPSPQSHMPAGAECARPFRLNPPMPRRAPGRSQASPRSAPAHRPQRRSALSRALASDAVFGPGSGRSGSRQPRRDKAAPASFMPAACWPEGRSGAPLTAAARFATVHRCICLTSVTLLHRSKRPGRGRLAQGERSGRVWGGDDPGGTPSRRGCDRGTAPRQLAALLPRPCVRPLPRYRGRGRPHRALAGAVRARWRQLAGAHAGCRA